MYRIMIIEDDAALSEEMKKQIVSWGNEAFCTHNFNDVLKDFSDYDPHLVLMDISLPFYNGYYWCGEIRKVSNVPVIFISSADDNMNIIMAIEMGADDFISKPFDLNVFTAKINAVLRRTYDLSGKAPLIEANGAVLNLNDMTLTFRENKIELTKNEFKILQTLMEQKGKVVGRSALMKRLWESDLYVEENTLTVNITRLRRKLGKAGLLNFIKTKAKSGYIVE